MSAFYWAAIVLIAAIGSPPVGAATMAVYGLALGANLTLGQRPLLNRREAHRELLRHFPGLRRILAVGLLSWCLLIIASMHWPIA